MEGLYIVLAVLALLLLFFAVLAIRALAVGRKAEELLPEPERDGELNRAYAERLLKMIQCKTVSSGKSYDDTEFAKLRGVMRELFPLIHERAELMSFSDDCWVYRLEGADSGRNIMLMSHHDVVPATGEWSHEPFGEIDGDVIWGRGTVDTKTSLFAEFSAVEELLAQGYTPPCNLYIASGHNEEVFGDGIPEAVKFFKKNGIEFELVIDEGGGVIAPPLAGIGCKCSMIAVHEKGRHAVKLRAVQGDTEAMAVNATPVMRIASFITEAGGLKYTRRLSPQLRATFEDLAPYMAFPLRLVFANLWCFAPLLLVLIPKISSQAAAMLGTTCTFTEVNSKRGAVPRENECSTTANFRFLTLEDLERDLEKFKNLAKKYDLEISEPEEGHEFHRSADISLEQYDFVRRCAKKAFPQTAVAPYILPAGTDARHLCDVSPCALRFAPIDINPQQFASVHSPNENINISALGAAVDFYKEVLVNYK